MRLTLVSPMFVLLLSGLLRAQDAKPIELTIQPRAIETPALKYRLLPAELEMERGNAVPILLRLPWEQTPWMTNVFPTLDEWQSRPLDAPEWKTSGGVLPENFYNEMKRAAFRREAVWEYPIGETPTPYLILLPDVQGLRGFLGRGLSARIRYHLSRGELDQAREGVLVGLANARHMAQTPFFINQLVAIAIHKVMLARTEELISQPNSPNLYWALSTLPDTLIEFDRTASLEGDIFAATFPAVNDLDRPRAAEEWRKMADQLVELLRQLDDLPPPEPAKADASVLEKILQRVTQSERPYVARWAKAARAELPAMLNLSEEQVAAMSDDEAAVRWYVHKRVAIDQRTVAVLLLPPREAWPQLKRVVDERQIFHDQTGAADLDYFQPVILYARVWSLNRKIAALRIIEAVRHHLAAHDGTLPSTLGEIRDVPIPLDPLTDQPFQWRVDGPTATLQTPVFPWRMEGEAAMLQASAAEQASRMEYRLQVNPAN